MATISACCVAFLLKVLGNAHCTYVLYFALEGDGISSSVLSNFISSQKNHRLCSYFSLNLPLFLSFDFYSTSFIKLASVMTTGWVFCYVTLRRNFRFRYLPQKYPGYKACQKWHLKNSHFCTVRSAAQTVGLQHSHLKSLSVIKTVSTKSATFQQDCLKYNTRRISTTILYLIEA